MKMLFICTHNRCRSILCEAIARQRGASRIEAASAGSQPAGQVHPDTLQYLLERNYDTTGLESQSWDEFAEFHPDVVITVCDSAAREACPQWFDAGARVHWGLFDPSKIEGSEQEIRDAFFNLIDEIERRIDAVLKLNLDNPDAGAIEREFNAIAGGS